MNLLKTYDDRAAGRSLDARTVIELGTIHRGPLQARHCEVALNIERQADTYALHIAVTSRDSQGKLVSRDLSWPYSCDDAASLSGVLNDLAMLQDDRNRGTETIPRSVAQRLADRFSRRAYRGSYRLTSVVDRPLAATTIKADVLLHGTETLVNLTTQRKGHRPARVQLPPMAFASMSRVLRGLMTARAAALEARN